MARDTLDVFGVRYTDVAGIKATDSTSTVQRYVRPEGILSITQNNVYDVASYASVSVNVQGGAVINNQDKAATPTESIQSITYDTGYTGLGTVTVNAISSNYVGTAIPVRSAADVQVTGPSVSGYSGYYSEAFSKTVETMTLPTVTNNLSIGEAKATIAFSTALRYLDIPKGFNSSSAFYTLESVPTMTLPTAAAATSTGTLKATIDRSTATRYLNIPTGYNSASAFYTIASVPNMTLPTTFPTTSTGTLKATIDRSTATRYLNIPTGYNSASAFYTIASVPNGTAYPPATISGNSATVTAGTNVLTFSKAISLTPNIATAGYISQGTASNITVTLSAAISTKAAATITPGTTNQTISSGYYLTGNQTIAGDADLVSANIKTGVQIFNVTGNYTADATASAADIKSGQTAYVNGSKLTGTLVTQTYYSGSTTPASSLGNNGDIYLKVS